MCGWWPNIMSNIQLIMQISHKMVSCCCMTCTYIRLNEKGRIEHWNFLYVWFDIKWSIRIKILEVQHTFSAQSRLMQDRLDGAYFKSYMLSNLHDLDKMNIQNFNKGTLRTISPTINEFQIQLVTEITFFITLMLIVRKYI